jgi:UDP-N-acetylglucosamine 2-epimerase (non-hydrolysing)
MKVVTWLGTRPEIIRLSRVIPLLDEHAEHTLVHTGQNYDENLSDVFFRDLQVRQPDVHLGIEASSFGSQAAQVIEKSFEFFSRTRPDRIVLLGDTNSGLAASASPSFTWKPATAASTIASPRRSTAASSTTAATC